MPKRHTDDPNAIITRNSELLKEAYKSVLMGRHTVYTERDWNEQQDIHHALRKQTVQESIYSGFLSLSPIETGLSVGINSIRFKEEQKVNIVGEIITIPAGTSVVLPEEPTHGVREDLVFLEAWYEEVMYTTPTTEYGREGASGSNPSFEDTRVTALNKEQTTRVAMKYRLRTVAGVDFNRFPEGIGDINNNVYATASTQVTPQGGLASPIAVSKLTSLTSFVGQKIRDNSSATHHYGKHAKDTYMFIAGSGKATKTEFNTVDGYVYAIPMFRVRRRNSSGYRDNNLSGGVKLKFFSQDYGTGGAIAKDEEFTLTVSAVDYANLRVGEVYRHTERPIYAIEVIEKRANNVVLLKNTGEALSSITTKHVLDNNGRPDKQYSNVIHTYDVKDLRRMVSMTGQDFSHILNREVNRYYRRESGQLDVMAKKDVFGAVRTQPSNVLTPVNVLGGDGKSRDLTNMMGTTGDMSDYTMYQKNGAVNPIYNYNSKTKTLSLTVPTGVNVSSPYKSIHNISKDKYYLIGVKNRLSGYVLIDGAMIPTMRSQINVKDTGMVTEKFLYIKVAPTNFNASAPSEGVSYLHLMVDGTGNTGEFRELRMYEITKEDYDKIDVDPEFTGDKLENKFPYVESPPVVRENILRAKAWKSGDAINRSQPTVWKTSKDGRRHTFHTPTQTAIISQEIRISNNRNYYISYETKSKENVRLTLQSKAGEVIYNAFAQDTTKHEFKIAETPSEETYVLTVANIGGQELTIEDIMLVDMTYGKPRGYVPDGASKLSWYSDTKIPKDLNRKVLSEAQSTDVVAQTINPTDKHNVPNITTTQATDGVWTAGDKITVTYEEGIVMGVVDSDTSTANVVETVGNSQVSPITVKVDMVNGFKVGDKLYKVVQGITDTSTVFTIDSVDTQYNSLRLSFTGQQTITNDMFFVEVTDSTSLPTITATGMTGTWSGVGTKEAVYTLTTPPTTNTSKVELKYSVVYPSGEGLKEFPQTIDEIRVNGVPYTKSDTLTFKANFKDKVTGSIEENPHIAKYGASELILPFDSPTWNELGKNGGSVQYTNITSLDKKQNIVSSAVSSSPKSLPQMLYSFDVVREYRRQTGREAKGSTTAEKVQWIKDNLTTLTFNWWGYGVTPTGNSASLKIWNGTSWIGSVSHTQGVTTKLDWGSILPMYIQSDGYVHFIAHTEATDGVTASLIHNDYVELSLNFNVAETEYEVYVPEIQEAVKVDDPIVNNGDNLIPAFNSGAWKLHPFSRIESPYTLEMTTTEKGYYSEVTIPIRRGMTYTLSSDAGDIYMRKDTINGEFLASYLESKKDGNTQNTFTATTDFNATVYVTTIANATPLQYKYSNPVLVVSEKKKAFVPSSIDVKKNKTLEIDKHNHKAFAYRTALLTTPIDSTNSEFTEGYLNLYKQDGKLIDIVSTTDSTYGQVALIFDLKTYNLSREELINQLKKLSLLSIGYGKGDSSGVETHGIVMSIFNFSTNSWQTLKEGTKTTPEYLKHDIEANVGNYIRQDQTVHVNLYAKYPTAGAIRSSVYVDYVNLTVQMSGDIDFVKKNVVKVRKETKEIKLLHEPYSLVTGRRDNIEVTYKYVAVPEIPTSGYHITVLEEMPNVFLTDLSSSVGHKQGEHHYKNILTLLRNDRRELRGTFGYSEVPLSADTKNANVGSKVTIQDYGYSGMYTTQLALSTIKRPMVAIMAYLVRHEDELKLLFISKFTTIGTDISFGGRRDTVAVLVPLSSRIIYKTQEILDRVATVNTFPKQWKTSSGQVQGYLNESGQYIPTYQ